MQVARRALAIAVCYLFVVQAFVAGLAAAGAIATAGTAGGMAIAAVCHGAGAPAQDDGRPPDAKCPHCAIAACGFALAAPVSGLAAPPQIATRLCPHNAATIARPAAARAGLARAPPAFA
jgi:hypothetical protein